MAETYLTALGGERFEVESAGLEPRPVNPLVVEVMREEGFDLSGSEGRGVFPLFKEGRLYDAVITVCTESEARCPIFPGVQRRLHWPFPDPEELKGSAEEKLAGVRAIRDAIRERVASWVEETRGDPAFSG
jgi:arsenate reductase